MSQSQGNRLSPALLSRIKLLFSKTPKQVQFEELVKDIQDSNEDLRNDLDNLIKVAWALLREKQGPYSSENEVPVGSIFVLNCN